MSLNVQVYDKDSDVPRTLPFGWGTWHLNIISAALDADIPGRKPGWRDHTFIGSYHATDETDGEVFKLNAGDTVKFF